MSKVQANVNTDIRDYIRNTITQRGNIKLTNMNTSDNSTSFLTLQTMESEIELNDVIGALDFKAHGESSGSDAILTAAGIEAVAEGAFSATSNATKLSFKTGASEAATEKMSLSSAGNLTLTGTLKQHKKHTLATKADGYTMTAEESGCVVLQSTNTATITLPATVAGLIYTFVWVGAAGETFNISPNASDKIMGSVIDVANGNIVSAVFSGAGADNKDLQLDSGSIIGDRVTLVADGNNGWVITEAVGSWVFEA